MKRRMHYDPFNDYYIVMGIEANATPTEIQQAYRQRAKQLHPDLNLDKVEWATQQFQLLNEAYAVLNDLEKRRDYNNARWAYGIHVPPRSQPHANTHTPPPGTPHHDYWRDMPPMREKKYSAPRQYGFEEVAYERPGAWLHRWNLGAVRPFYAAIVDLLRSPYRYVLIVCGVLVIINLAVILGTSVMGSSEESAPDQATPVVTVTQQAFGGLIATTESTSETCVSEECK